MAKEKKIIKLLLLKIYLFIRFILNAVKRVKKIRVNYFCNIAQNYDLFLNRHLKFIKQNKKAILFKQCKVTSNSFTL